MYIYIKSTSAGKEIEIKNKNNYIKFSAMSVTVPVWGSAGISSAETCTLELVERVFRSLPATTVATKVLHPLATANTRETCSKQSSSIISEIQNFTLRLDSAILVCTPSSSVSYALFCVSDPHACARVNMRTILAKETHPMRWSHAEIRRRKWFIRH